MEKKIKRINEFMNESSRESVAQAFLERGGEVELDWWLDNEWEEHLLEDFAQYLKCGVEDLWISDSEDWGDPAGPVTFVAGEREFESEETDAKWRVGTAELDGAQVPCIKSVEFYSGYWAYYFCKLDLIAISPESSAEELTDVIERSPNRAALLKGNPNLPDWVKDWLG